MKILLACQTATNKGDRAIAEYIIKKLTEQGHEVVLSTTRPALWETANVPVIRMGYRSIVRKTKSALVNKALRVISKLICDKLLFANLIKKRGKHRLCQWVSREFIAAIRDADLVIVTGGHHITSIREKNAMFQFTYDIGLVSLYAKRYVLWSQTIGPLEFTSERAKTFIGDTIKKAEKVYIRDENSLKCIDGLYGKLANLVKTYDSVFGYGDMEFPDVADREKKVGIAIFDGLKKAFNTYDTLAKMLDLYVANGYAVEFFRMEYNDAEQNSIQQIISKMQQKGDFRIHPFMTTTEAHLKEVASCRCFIGYKTHSVIMALTTATPLIAVAYHKKTVDFMNDFDLGAYAIDDEALDETVAKKCMAILEENMLQIQQAERLTAKKIAAQLEKDLFDMLNNEY